MTNRILRLTVSLLLLASLWMSSGCMSTKAKIAAIKTVTELDSALNSQYTAYDQAIESLVRQNLEAQRSLLQARWSERREQLRIELMERADERLRTLRQELYESINKDLAPVEDRLNAEIKAERGRGAAGAERASALTLQLAATMAIAQREVAKEDERTQQRMLEVRANLRQDLDKAFATPPDFITKPASDEEIAALLAEYRKSSAERRAALKQTTDSLADYVSADEPWKLFVKGLVGDELFKLIGPNLSKATANLQNQFDSALEKASARVKDYAEKKIGAVTNKP